MPNIYEIKCDIHCPRCGAKIDKKICICMECLFNILAYNTGDEGNSIKRHFPENRDIIFQHCRTCIQNGNHSEAAVYYQLFASRFNDASAMYELGELFLMGLGVPQSPRMARICFEKAAALSDIPSIIKLGKLYYHGIYGFPRDKKAAIQWLEDAASFDDESNRLYQDLSSILSKHHASREDYCDEEEDGENVVTAAYINGKCEQDDSLPQSADLEYHYNLFFTQCEVCKQYWDDSCVTFDRLRDGRLACQYCLYLT